MKQIEFYEVDGCTDFIPVKLIEEHKHMTNSLKVELTETGNRTFVRHMYSFPKVNEPQKVVVPAFIDSLIKYTKAEGMSLFIAMVKVQNKEPEWIIKHEDTFARAWLDGYEIEQEKLYTVEIPNPNSAGGKLVLFKQQSSGRLILDILNPNINKPKYLHITESEIKKDFEWAWQWAKPVEEK